MIKNYLLISFRNLRKHFTYSVINILGLGLGLATVILLSIWIHHELSFDAFHAKSDRIYRASMEYSFGGQVAGTSVSPTALLPTLQKNFPDIENGVRVYNPASYSPYIVKRDEVIFQEDHFYFADSSFFKIFSYPLVSGNPDKVLAEPYSVVLTQASAKKYFGDQDPVGKTISINGTQDYQITGIAQNIPTNSYLQFDFIASFHSLRAGREEPIWWTANYQTFVVLDEHADVNTIQNKTNGIVQKIMAPELTGEGDYVRYNFMKLTDIHLRSPFSAEMETVGNIQYVYIFSAVAILILLIACINYINLATARASDRAREVGIRKVAGAVRTQLFLQFLGESVVITFLGFCVAFLFSQVALPFFNELTGATLSHDIFYRPGFLLTSVALLVVIAVLSGAYPAFAITAFKPVSILKGNFKFSGKGIWLRKFLVVGQFIISVILIVGTMVILKQLNFIQDKNLGYTKESTIMLPLDQRTGAVYSQLKTEFLRNGNVSFVGRATESPVQIKGGYGMSTDETTDHGIIATGVAVDDDYIRALGMKFISGRNFTEADFKRVQSDTLYSFIVNEAALKELSLTAENAIGKKAHVNGRTGEIIGVVQNFHFASLHQAIGPLVMFNEEGQYNFVFVKLNTRDMQATLTNLKSVYASLVSHRPFEYEFIDQQFEAMYSAEQRMGSIFTVFATLAIFIACLGLLGLVSFSASQKTKEIGIRKVLGASASNIVVLITRDYTRLVIVAIAMGIPTAYWIMTQWLGDFAYRTEIGWWPIVAATVLCIFIAFATASYQAIKAAWLNPASTLRSE
ncbi:MAG: ABC transporter permease [Cyclobacteriaceae bacterium]